MKSYNVAFVAGMVAIGATIAISNVNIVSASAKLIPMLSCNSSNPCRTFSNFGTGAGVAGTNSSSGPAVQGISYGQGPGVNASAVYDGIDAYSSNLAGGYFNGGYEGVFAVGSTSNAFPLVASNSQTGKFMEVDQYGNVYASGAFIGNALWVHHHTPAGEVATYAAQSAQSTVDDVGSAQMVAGRAMVAIEPAFAHLIDPSSYHVFLTPRGDSRGLYISAQGSRSFEVRESQGGRSTIAFDYRIVGRPIDAERTRLPAITIQHHGTHPHR